MIHIVHPHHPVPKEIDDAFRAHDKQNTAAVAQEIELANLARPSAREREFKAKFHARFLEASDIDADQYVSERADLRKAQFEQMRDFVPLSHRSPSVFAEFDFKPKYPEPVDPTFWWADTNIFYTDPFVGGCLLQVRCL